VIIYKETDDGWSFSQDTDTSKVIPGEFRFVTFNGSPCIEYSSGGYVGVRTLDVPEDETRQHFLEMGFVEVDHEIKAAQVEDPQQLSLEDSRWLASQLSPGDYFQFGDQYIFSLTEDEMNHWLPKLEAWRETQKSK
jgi:hypothetical protein